MTAIVRLLAVLLNATPPDEAMSRLLRLDEAALARRVQAQRWPDNAAHNVPEAGNAGAQVGVNA